MEEDDPAIIRARSRSERGLSRELTQNRTLNPPMPSRGGTRGFPVWQRLRALENLADHGDYGLAADRVGCHPISVRRWERRVVPYRMTGGGGKNGYNRGRSISTFDLPLYIPKCFVQSVVCFPDSERWGCVLAADRHQEVYGIGSIEKEEFARKLRSFLAIID